MNRKWSSWAAVPSVLAVFFINSFSVHSASPSIQITNCPAYGAYGNLSGFVVNGNPATQKVAVFAYVGGGWYSKPNCAQHLTSINANGSWTANITPVASDINATIIAAFLVPTNYSVACVEGLSGLPTAAYQQALATAFVSRFNPAARQITFSDYTWWVKASSGLAGPGPNYFSDSTNNVWVDAEGKLHLRITHRNNQWQCAEIISARSFGYGQYRFTVTAQVNNLDPSVILGLFTWSNDSSFNNREIDVEVARWNKPTDPTCAQFVIQPANTVQIQRFAVPSDVTNSTYTYTWQPGRVDFQAMRGDYSPAPGTNILRTWTCTAGIPQAGGENMRFNLWLNKGNAPTNGQEVEIIMDRFEFVPLGAPQPAQIRGLDVRDGTAQLSVSGQTDRRYQIHASSNLRDWIPLDRILATNDTFQYTDGDDQLASRFYRAVTEP